MLNISVLKQKGSNNYLHMSVRTGINWTTLSLSGHSRCLRLEFSHGRMSQALILTEIKSE